jgi:hypothetical protein
MGSPLTSDEVVTRYRGRAIRAADLEEIRATIAKAGANSERGAIAASICESWDWRQPRGKLATRACRDLLLRLEEWGHIELPSRRVVGDGPRRRKFPLLPQDLIPLAGLEVGSDADLSSLIVRPIAAEEREGWRLYMSRYHYLGCRPIVGEHILYAAMLGEELVALLGWASAAFRAPLREAYIGWDDAAKRERLHLVADNVRFLVLPWVRVPNLASKILGANLQRLSEDWEEMWGHPIHLAETFVDTRRFRGTCYRASNWVYLGQTAGRSKRGNAYLHEGTSKGLFVYPLRRQALSLLVGKGPSGATFASEPDGVAPAGAYVRAVIDDAAERCDVTGDAVDAGHRGHRNPGGGEPAAAEPFAEQNAELNATSPSNHGASDEGVRRLVLASASPSPEKHGSRASLATVTATLTAIGAGQKGTPLDEILTAGSDILQSVPLPSAQKREPSVRLAETPNTAPRMRRTNKTPIRIDLTEAEKASLERQARGLAIPHRTVVRSKIILLLAASEPVSGVARKLRCSRRIVQKWGDRFVRKRLDGLVDAERSGRPPRFSPRSCNSPGEARLRAP